MRPRHCLVRPARDALFALTLMFALPPTPVAAQALYGGMTGTTTDEPGAAVPGVAVAIRNEKNGFRAHGRHRRNRHLHEGNPVTGFTDSHFMRIRSLARAPRTVQVGARFTF